MGRPVLTTEARRTALPCAIALGLFVCTLNTCSPEPKETTTGGETHFLTACNANDLCGSALACVCGMCTKPCSSDDSCRSLPGSASCVPTTDLSAAESCADPSTTSVCGVTCTDDATCQRLSESHRCTGGFCRADSCTRGQVTASEVLFVGDSFFAGNHQIPLGVEQLAQQAGVIGTSDHYRDKSSLAGNSLALAPPTIADQYASGRTEGTVQVVVMNAGGADVLGATCNDPPTEACPGLANAATAISQLLSQMAQDGVRQVVYCFYPDPVDSAVRAKMDVLRPLIQVACENSAVPCHWLDLRPTFANHYSEYILADGMNPTDAGATAAAAAIWSTMQGNCVAQ